jgi:MFS family permease
MILQALATACIEIPLSLYVMDQIGRRDIGRFEPMRIFFAASVYTLGPGLGVLLGTRLAPWAPLVLAAASASALLGYFWYLRLKEHPAVPAAKGPPPNPLDYLPHFARQPRLRLAWVLAVGRSIWWAIFFVYAPIYVVTAGLDPLVGGLIASLASVWFYVVPLWGAVGRRFGLRRLLIGGYAATGIVTLVAAALAGAPWLAALALVLGAFCAAAVDGAGNVPFLRAVRPLERAQMTSVFVTYRHTSQIIPPGVCALLLQVFALPAVFVTAAATVLWMAFLSRHIPRGM